MSVIGRGEASMLAQDDETGSPSHRQLLPPGWPKPKG
jgi:hypothetical protein